MFLNEYGSRLRRLKKILLREGRAGNISHIPVGALSSSRAGIHRRLQCAPELEAGLNSRPAHVLSGLVSSPFIVVELAHDVIRVTGIILR